jgi:hypothetical protein
VGYWALAVGYVRSVLGLIGASALVICRSREVWLPTGISGCQAHEVPGSQLAGLRGVDHGPQPGDDEQVLTAAGVLVVGLYWPCGVAAGVRPGASEYLKIVWVPSR